MDKDFNNLTEDKGVFQKKLFYNIILQNVTEKNMLFTHFIVDLDGLTCCVNDIEGR